MDFDGLDDEDVAAPGWDAIDEACARVYGEQEPLHYGTVTHGEGGEDPLDGVSIYCAHAGRRHWHYVSYGLSELYEKETEDSDVSGFGLELTFRLAADSFEGEPPMWPMNLMQNLAEYVFETGNAFDEGHKIDVQGPIALEEETKLCVVSFAMDPELGEISTPNGVVRFLQMVPLTLDEAEATRNWDVRKMQGLLAERVPRLITDLGRDSILTDAGVAARVVDGVKRDGSSMGVAFTDQLEIEPGSPIVVKVGATSVPDFLTGLRYRLPYGVELTLVGPEQALTLKPGGATRWDLEADDEELRIQLAPKDAEALAGSLIPKRGSYTLPALQNLLITVEPTSIVDEEGNVVRVVG